MSKTFQVTVADADGVVIDTGWIALDDDVTEGKAGHALFEDVLGAAVQFGVEVTGEDAIRALEETGAAADATGTIRNMDLWRFKD